MGTLIGSTFRNALAIRYNGSTQYSTCPLPSFGGDLSGAISVRIKPSVALTGIANNTFLGMGMDSPTNNAFFNLRQTARDPLHPTNNYVRILTRPVHNGPIQQIIWTTTALNIGAWNHLLVMSNGGAYVVYVNGILQTSTIIIAGADNGDWLGDITGTTKRLIFGGHWVTGAPNPSLYWAGDIDEFNYFDLLNPAEALVLYNGGTPINPYRLNLAPSRWKTWLRCGDSRDVAATMFDERGANDFTNVNSPTYVSP